MQTFGGEIVLSWKSISRSEIGCAVDNHNYMGHIWAKEF